MQYLLSMVFALMLVTAQSFWKVSVDAHKNVFSGVGTVGPGKYVSFIFAPYTLLGVVLYIVATALYMFMLSRYNYSRIQAVAIPLTLVFAITIGAICFSERLSMVNLIGVSITIVGLVLIVFK